MSETPKDLIVEVSYLLSGRTKTRTCSPDSQWCISFLTEGRRQNTEPWKVQMWYHSMLALRSVLVGIHAG